MLSDTSKRRRLMAAFAGGLTVAVALVAVGLALGIASLAIVGLLMVAGLVGALGKVLASVAVYVGGSTRRLKTLNDRYDDTEVWLEQFDKGTRATFGNITKSLKDAQSERERLEKELAYRAGKLDELVQRSATREAMDASVKAGEAQAQKLAAAVEAIRKDLEKASAASGALGKRLDEIAGLAKAQERAAKSLAEADERLGAMVETMKSGLAEVEKQVGTGAGAKLHEAAEATKKQLTQAIERIETIDKSVKNASSLTGRLRGDGYAQFNRLIGAEFIKEVQEKVGPRLGVELSQRELRYLERKVQNMEALCEGRLATTSEDAVARVLAARSRVAEELNILEIGVLFGVGAAFMHTALSPFYERVRLVLLDPFDGYYGPEHLDPLTGQRVSRSAVERNLARATIPAGDVTILAGFSTDDGVREQARKAGPYDVIVIDGDHSYEGVKADFERYAEMLSPGGVLIVDDYGSEDWPDVTKYVDQVVSADDRFEKLGSLSRTAIFRMKGLPAAESAGLATESESTEKDGATTAEKPKAPRPARGAPKKSPKKAEPASEAVSAAAEKDAEPSIVQTRRGASKKKQAKSAGAGSDQGA